MELVYLDSDLIVCIKPQGVLSVDEPGGVPDLARQALGDAKADVRTVHRLDRVTGGLMVLARSRTAAAALSQSIRDGRFHKTYLAVVHGRPKRPEGTMTDLLLRDAEQRMSHVVQEVQKGAQQAVLDYRTVCPGHSVSVVEISLRTGRTHQIRAQFAHRGMPLVGDRKYGRPGDEVPTALWSCRLSFPHPGSGALMDFSALPPDREPWTAFLPRLRAYQPGKNAGPGPV